MTAGRPLVTTLAFCALLAAGAAAGAQQPDLSGTWTLSLLEKSPHGFDSAEMTIEVDGHQIVAHLASDQGSVPCVGYVDGQAIHFYYVRPGKKEDTIVRFSGHVRGDLMGGEVDLGKRGSSTWTATRGEDQGVDLTGVWTLQMKGESPSGLDLVKMRFSQERDHVVVTLESELGEVECEGFLDGRTLTFYYVRVTGESRFVAKFTGQLAGGMMGGEVDLGEHGKTTWRATRDV
jgi:hypothetical protein